jgi:hypothetical protein
MRPLTVKNGGLAEERGARTPHPNCSGAAKRSPGRLSFCIYALPLGLGRRPLAVCGLLLARFGIIGSHHELPVAVQRRCLQNHVETVASSCGKAIPMLSQKSSCFGRSITE